LLADEIAVNSKSPVMLFKSIPDFFMAKSKQLLSEIDKNYVAGFLGSQQVKIVLPMIIPFHLNVGVTLCVSCGLTQ
jgi:hypothetical protein